MRIGIGLGVIPVLGVILNFFYIPIDWKIFLLLSLIMPCYYVIKNKGIGIPPFRLTKSNISILIVLLLFFLTLFMHEKGAFAYAYLEDDDSWHYAQSVKYISMKRTAYEEEDINILSFTDAYPPGYSITLAILHQTSNSISWTIKFFNALIISLGIIFFYFFVKHFTNDKNKALFATFILTIIPSYLSHFIWSHALIVTLFFPAFYCLEMLKNNKKWIIPSSLVIGSILIIQPTQAIKFGIFFLIYWIIKIISQRELSIRILVSGILGFLLSFFWWGAMLLKYQGLRNLLTFMGFVGMASGRAAKEGVIGVFGTASRAYTFNDFFVAQKQNMINNPIGIGIVVSILLIIALGYIIINCKILSKRENNWILISLIWFIFTFLGVNSITFNLPVALFAFRFWMLMAIPISILASVGLWFLFSSFKKIGIGKNIVLLIIVVGVLLTSGYQKYTVNTAIWPPGATWTSYDEVNGYSWLKTLPIDTKVFAFTKDRSNYIIGFDKFMCVWCKEDMDFQKNAINKTAEELHNWLKRKKYEYITIGGKEAIEFGINETNKRINDMVSSGLFQLAHQTKGVLIMKITT
jgi:4-amino-4-deoxy-L-arabinose transferase-like glycosyltransferase